MRRLIVRAVFTTVLVCLALQGEALAQNREKAWELFPYVGYVSLSHPDFGDTVEVRPNTPAAGTNQTTILESSIRNEPSVGLRFGYHWSKRHMMEFAFEGTATDAMLVQTVIERNSTTGAVTSRIVSTEDLSVDLLALQVDYVYNFFMHRRDKVVAYVSGGFGIVNTSVFGLTAVPTLRPILDEFVGETNDLATNYGVGVRFFGSEKVGFRIDLRQVEYAPGNRADQDYFEASMGVSLILGGL